MRELTSHAMLQYYLEYIIVIAFNNMKIVDKDEEFTLKIVL